MKDLSPEELQQQAQPKPDPKPKKKRSTTNQPADSTDPQQQIPGQPETASPPKDTNPSRPSIQQILAEYRLKNPSKKKNKQQRQEEVQQELQDMLEQSDLANVSQKTIGQLVERYYREHRGQLSVEAKSTMALLEKEGEKELQKKFDEPSKMELIKEDIENMDFRPNFSELSGVFQSGDSPVPLSLKEQSKIEAKRIATNYMLSEEVASALVKEHVFLKKREEELNAKLEEKRLRNLKIKQVKKQLELIKSREFKIQEDEYDHIKNLLQKKTKEQFMGLLESPKKLEQKQTRSEKVFQIYRLQTETRLMTYVQDRLSHQSDQLQSYLYGHNIEVEKISLNNGISVLDIFWNFQTEPDYDMDDYRGELMQNTAVDSSLPLLAKKSQAIVDANRKRKELADKISDNLEKWSKHRLSFELMRDMGFKKQIELRFYHSDIMKQESLLEDQMKDSVSQIVMEQIKADLEEGTLKPYQVTSDYVQSAYEQLMLKLNLQFKPNLGLARIAREKRLLKQEGEESNESDQTVGTKSDSRGKKVNKPRLRDLKANKKADAAASADSRFNRNPDGSRKKYHRPNAAGEFWASLQD